MAIKCRKQLLVPGWGNKEKRLELSQLKAQRRDRSIVPFSSQSLWVFIPLGSQTFLWVLFILHPPDSLTIYVVCHLAALKCEVLSFLVAGKKLNMSKQKPSLQLWEREKCRLYLGDFYGMMRCELLEHLFYFSMSRFASSSPFFSRGHMFPQVFTAKV